VESERACWIRFGSLPKADIDGAVKDRMGGIRGCYQRELLKNPNLSGTVTVKFVIAPDGSVRSADIKSTTWNDAQVEGCIAEALLRCEFPEPTGGGIVIVSCPFVFTPG